MVSSEIMRSLEHKTQEDEERGSVPNEKVGNLVVDQNLRISEKALPAGLFCKIGGFWSGWKALALCLEINHVCMSDSEVESHTDLLEEVSMFCVCKR